MAGDQINKLPEAKLPEHAPSPLMTQAIRELYGHSNGGAKVGAGTDAEYDRMEKLCKTGAAINCEPHQRERERRMQEEEKFGNKHPEHLDIPPLPDMHNNRPMSTPLSRDLDEIIRKIQAKPTDTKL